MNQQEQVEDEEEEFEDGEVVTELNDNNTLPKEQYNEVNIPQDDNSDINKQHNVESEEQCQIQQQINDVHTKSDLQLTYGVNIDQQVVNEQCQDDKNQVDNSNQQHNMHISQEQHDDDEFESGELIDDDIPQQQEQHDDDEFEGGEIIVDEIPQQQVQHDDDEFKEGELIDDMPPLQQVQPDDDEFEEGELIDDDMPQQQYVQEIHNDNNVIIQEQIAESSGQQPDDDDFEDGEIISADPPDDDDDFEDGEIIVDDIPQQQHRIPPVSNDDDEFAQGEVISTPSTTNTTVVENAYYLTAQSDDDIKLLFQQTFHITTPSTCQLNEDTYYVIEEPKLQDDHQHIQQLIESEQGQNASSQLKSMFLDQISNDYNLWINYTPYQCLIEQFQLHIESPVFEIQDISDMRNNQDSPEKGDNSPQSSGLISSHKALKSSIFFPVQEVQVKKVSEAPVVDNILDLIPDYSYLLLQNIQIKE